MYSVHIVQHLLPILVNDNPEDKKSKSDHLEEGMMCTSQYSCDGNMANTYKLSWLLWTVRNVRIG